mgnify:CR=1 FL=1
MKRVVLILLIGICLSGISNMAYSQVEDTVVFEDSIAKKKLDKKLIKIAKEVVLQHGPGYYREYKEPVIKYRRVTSATRDLHYSTQEKNMGRVYYTVEYPYDIKKEVFNNEYSVKVYFWEDLTVFDIFFGHGMGILDYDKLTRTEKKKIVIPFKKRIPFVEYLDTVWDEKGNIIEIWHRYRKQDTVEFKTDKK